MEESGFEMVRVKKNIALKDVDLINNSIVDGRRFDMPADVKQK